MLIAVSPDLDSNNYSVIQKLATAYFSSSHNCHTPGIGL